jgi:hypothetical protein
MVGAVAEQTLEAWALAGESKLAQAHVLSSAGSPATRARIRSASSSS